MSDDRATVHNALRFVDCVIKYLLVYFSDCNCLSARKDNRKMGMVVMKSP